MNSNTAQQKSIYTDILNHKIQSYPPLSLTHRYLVHLSSLTLSFKEMQWFITNIFHRYHYITLFFKRRFKIVLVNSSWYWEFFFWSVSNPDTHKAYHQTLFLFQTPHHFKKKKYPKKIVGVFSWKSIAQKSISLQYRKI